VVLFVPTHIPPAIMPLIRSISGLRGTIGDSLTPAAVVRYASAFARFAPSGDIVVGRDGRPSGTWIERLLVGTLQACGRDVQSLGMAPTPTIQLATERANASGGVAITASHNPSDWNGLKFLGPDGIFLGADDCQRLFELVDAQPPGDCASWDEAGVLHDRSDAVAEHVALVLSLPFVDLQRIRDRRLKVVVDAVNASGSYCVPDILEQCGCEVVRLFCDGSGLFPHLPEPLPENLGDLSRAVSACNADVGIAVDPDADRLVIVDEHGAPIGEEYTITLAADFMLRYTAARGEPPQTVVVNLSTTRAVDDVARRYGASVVRTPVGEVNVARRMLDLGAVIGGEGSGGVIFPSLHAGRDSLVGIAILLSSLAESNGSMSDLRAGLPSYQIAKRKIDLAKNVSITNKFDAIAAQDSGTVAIRRDDGLRVDTERGWVHMRASNTEPIVRVIAEASDAAEAEALALEYMERLASA